MDKGEENDGDPQFWKEKFPAADGKASHGLLMRLFFPFLRWGGRDFLFFPRFFPICSPKFSKASQNVPHNT
jgi:hypothetical protein